MYLCGHNACNFDYSCKCRNPKMRGNWRLLQTEHNSCSSLSDPIRIQPRHVHLISWRVYFYNTLSFKLSVAFFCLFYYYYFFGRLGKISSHTLGPVTASFMGWVQVIYLVGHFPDCAICSRIAGEFKSFFLNNFFTFCIRTCIDLDSSWRDLWASPKCECHEMIRGSDNCSCIFNELQRR